LVEDNEGGVTDEGEGRVGDGSVAEAVECVECFTKGVGTGEGEWKYRCVVVYADDVVLG
jgi:hypothetical protein